MRILIACEESQAVCIEFRKLGHEAYSCDTEPCSGGHPEWHLQQDVTPLLEQKWDMIIAFPPCTYFSNAGLHYLKTKPERLGQLDKAFIFLKKIWDSDCDKIAIENTVGWLSTNWKKPTQIIQPYFFGDKELKTTCLWLKGLKKLTKTNDVGRPEPRGFVIRKSGRYEGKKYNYYFHQSKTAKERSKTFTGVAKAMADQWGNT